MEDDDEVSTVLRHFRPKPGFVPVNELSPGVGSPLGQKRRRRERGFTSFKYIYDAREGGKLRLAYLHERNVLLKFDIGIQPLGVSCALCNGPPCYPSDAMANLQEKITNICKDMSQSKEPSLFSFLSRLLQKLNRDLRPVNCTALHEREDCVALARRLAVTTSSPIRDVQHVLDVNMLIMRAAAAGRNRTELCSPVPQEFIESSVGDAIMIANNVFSSTDLVGGINLSGRWRSPSISEHQNVPSLLAFLLSLPWADGGIFEVIKTRSTTSSNVVHLCLNVERSLGDETPGFARLAKERGVVTAYHGTKIENAWSILNVGLQNLSNHGKLSQNGAMMGDGVYLSNSYKVAAFFAQGAARKSRTLALAFRHPSLLRLLGASNVDISKLGPLDDYIISALPVFEASIIAPPETAFEGKSRSKNCTRREGKYFVVPSSDLIRITKLHLTLELVKKRKMMPPFSLFCIVIACFVFLIVLLRVLGGDPEEWEY